MLQKVHGTGDPYLSRIQSYIDTQLTKLQDGPLTGGNIVSGIQLNSTVDNLVSHGLGYTPSYFVILSISANSTVWTQAPTSVGFALPVGTNANSSLIDLWCSASCTVTVWFK